MEKIAWIVLFATLSVGTVYTWSGSSPALQAGPPRFDFTNETTRTESVRRVKDSLTPERRKLLAKSIMRLSFKKLTNGKSLFASLQDVDQFDMYEAVRGEMHGRTAEEVIAAAANVHLRAMDPSDVPELNLGD